LREHPWSMASFSFIRDQTCVYSLIVRGGVRLFGHCSCLQIDYEAGDFVVWQWQREHLEPCHRLWEMFPRTARLSLRYYGDLPGRQQERSRGAYGASTTHQRFPPMRYRRGSTNNSYILTSTIIKKYIKGDRLTSYCFYANY
jgi:hypothetical protein